MRIIKKCIISICIFSIAIILLIILLKLKADKPTEINNVISNEVNKEVVVTEVGDKISFFTVQKYVDEYIQYIKEKDTEALYNILDKKYITDNNINVENVLEYVNYINSENRFITINMNVLYGKACETYAIYGSDYTYDGQIQNNKIYIKLKLDIANRTFSITPLLNNYESLDEVNMSIDEDIIEKNYYNEYEYYMVTEEDICRKCLEHYQYNALCDVKVAYGYLDEEYRQKRFENINDYEKYIENNYQEIEDITLLSYFVNDMDGYTEYICVDTKDNYYCFKLKNLMYYKLILDNYTIETEKYISLYNSASNNEKVVTNIDKFIKMINNTDYKAAYNLLSSGFKNNYLPTQQDFESYVKENFFKTNIFSLTKIEEMAGIYKCTANISSGVSASAMNMEKTFLVKLNEGTNFELSFNME